MNFVGNYGYESQPRRMVRSGYLPPKPEWDEATQKAWDKYQASLGRYPGNISTSF